MSSFEAEKKIESLISNDMSPQLSTVDVLSSLKLISHFEGKIEAGDENATTKIAQEELRYLTLAMNILEDTPSLSQRFGRGFSGAMAVSGLLKQRNSERAYKKIIDEALDKGAGSTDLNTSVIRANGRGIGGREIRGRSGAPPG